MSDTRINKKVNDFLGTHPSPCSFACYTTSNDSHTDSQIPHRALQQEPTGKHETISQLRSALIRHHASPEMLTRERRKKESLRKFGYPAPEDMPHRFPRADKTRKGNLAEVFLAEYIVATSGASLPVYRLRYNPNVEQSMKGDDVLVFDFESDPVRILVGEAKFRGTPSKKAVTDIVDGLIRSHQTGLPISLQFVADRLFESGNNELGSKVEECVNWIAQGRLDLLYVGLLMSNTNAASLVKSHTENNLRNLVMISLGVEHPNDLISACYDGIEEEYVNGDSF
ncbi:MAG: Hachiman antiphage defense system protein HamA [Phycisphaerae bacterium]